MDLIVPRFATIRGLLLDLLCTIVTFSASLVRLNKGYLRLAYFFVLAAFLLMSYLLRCLYLIYTTRNFGGWLLLRLHLYLYWVCDGVLLAYPYVSISNIATFAVASFSFAHASLSRNSWLRIHLNGRVRVMVIWRTYFGYHIWSGNRLLVNFLLSLAPKCRIVTTHCWWRKQSYISHWLLIGSIWLSDLYRVGWSTRLPASLVIFNVDLQWNRLLALVGRGESWGRNDLLSLCRLSASWRSARRLMGSNSTVLPDRLAVILATHIWTTEMSYFRTVLILLLLMSSFLSSFVLSTRSSRCSTSLYEPVVLSLSTRRWQRPLSLLAAFFAISDSHGWLLLLLL